MHPHLTFIAHSLVRIHQKKKMAPEIAVKISSVNGHNKLVLADSVSSNLSRGPVRAMWLSIIQEKKHK
jgi:hypothetical protein